MRSQWLVLHYSPPYSSMTERDIDFAGISIIALCDVYQLNLQKGSRDGLVVINRASYLCEPGSPLALRSYVG